MDTLIIILIFGGMAALFVATFYLKEDSPIYKWGGNLAKVAFGLMLVFVVIVSCMDGMGSRGDSIYEQQYRR